MITRTTSLRPTLRAPVRIKRLPTFCRPPASPLRSLCVAGAPCGRSWASFPRGIRASVHINRGFAPIPLAPPNKTPRVFRGTQLSARSGRGMDSHILVLGPSAQRLESAVAQIRSRRICGRSWASCLRGICASMHFNRGYASLPQRCCGQTKNPASFDAGLFVWWS